MVTVVMVGRCCWWGRGPRFCGVIVGRGVECLLCCRHHRTLGWCGSGNKVFLSGFSVVREFAVGGPACVDEIFC